MCCALLFTFKPTFSDTVKDTTKIQLKVEYVDFVGLLQNAAQHANFESLSKYTQDTVFFEMRMVKEEPLGEKMSKFDALDILQQCENIFQPDSLTLYVGEKCNQSGERIYVIEIKRDDQKSYFAFSVYDNEIRKISILR
jgi:hypothetical protein